jgi:hypothetical protein
MTKTSIFGQPEVKQDEKKPIEFVKYFNGDKAIATRDSPCIFENVILLEKNYFSDDYDLMWAYGENPNDGSLYLGHWNDGVV